MKTTGTKEGETLLQSTNSKRKNENWKDIPGYEGYYQISDRGNVRSLDRVVRYVNGRTAKYKGKKVAINTRPNGYLKANLYKDHTIKNVTIHRLVAESFIPNPNGFPEINHKDEDKTNNCVSNLEWCTSSYNSNYGTAKKRWAAKNSTPVKGTNIITGEVIYLKSMTEGKKHGFSQQGISDVCMGKYQTHKGHFFEKIEKDEKN